MTDGGTKLNVLAFRFTPDLAGDVRRRRLSEEFRAEWKRFEFAYKDKVGRDVQAPHKAVALALRGYLGHHAHFDPVRGELVTERDLDDLDILDLFTLFEAFALGKEPDLDQPCALAEFAADSPVTSVHLGTYLERGPGQPNPPDWVYETVSWSFARSLAAHPFEVDGLQIALRDDTEGCLYAWEDLWTGTVLRPVPGTKDKRAEPRFSMAKIRPRLKTVPNLAHTVVLLDGSSTRISPTLRGVSTALVEQKAAGAPLVRLNLDGRIARHVNRPAAQTLARLAVDRAVLDLEDFTTDPIAPGRVRGIVPKSWRFAIGRGVGMHFHRELYRHVQEVFPGISEVPTRPVRTRLIAPRQGRAELSALAGALREHGHTALVIVCLWSGERNRLRMLTELGVYFDTDLVGADLVDGCAAEVSPEVKVVTIRAEEALAHGRGADRRTHLEGFVALQPVPGTLTVVLCETDSDHGARAAAEEAARIAAGEKEPETDEEARAAYKRFLKRKEELAAQDSKPQVRRILAQLGHVSQFLDQPKPPARRRSLVPPKHGDYPARAAITDLLRSAGLVDDRFTHVLGGLRVGDHQANAMAHIGIHVRQQNRRARGGKTKLVVTMTAMLPPRSGSDQWTLRAWTHRDQAVWEPYPAACARFHAEALLPGSRSRDDLVRLADIVEHALGTLTDRLPTGVPYIVYLDGHGSRGVWPGLLNNRQGTASDLNRIWLPGATLPPRQRPLAVVRVNASPDETPRPVGATTVTFDSGDRPVARDAKTVNRLFRIETDFGGPAFWLSRVPAQYDGAGSGRLGEHHTRWGEEEGPRTRRTWYSMNAVEFYPIAALPDEVLEALAVVAARLCRQTSGWEGQTTYPEPVHLARQLDLDHPEFRAEELTDDPESPLLAEDE